MNFLVLRCLLMFPALIYVSVTDLKRHEISNRACLFLLVIGLILPIWHGWDLGWREVFTATSLTLVIGFVFFIFGMGAGDVKLLTAIASLVGYKILAVTLISAIILGVAVLVLLLAKKVTLSTRIPLAPGFALGTLICVIFYVL